MADGGGGHPRDHAFWRAFPKVELHLHLEGAAPPALARETADRLGFDLEGVFDDKGAYVWHDFTSFLQCYDRVAKVFRTPETGRLLSEAVLRECAAQGVIYAEITLSPDHCGGDFGKWKAHLEAVTEGVEAAEAATGIVGRFIGVGVRHVGAERVERSARFVCDVDNPRMVGFNIAGDERLGRTPEFRRAFEIARDHGLRLTAHAGEFGGPDSVRAVLDDLGVERVGHGVRAIEDPAIVRRLAEEQIALEVCPGSNIALGVYDGWAAHPMPRLRDAGCKVTLSTDDPPFFHTDMTREYVMAAEIWGWSVDDLRAVTLAGLDAAFCDDATKARLAARIDQGGATG
jgi:adenosine deaminase